MISTTLIALQEDAKCQSFTSKDFMEDKPYDYVKEGIGNHDFVIPAPTNLNTKSSEQIRRNIEILKGIIREEYMRADLLFSNKTNYTYTNSFFNNTNLVNVDKRYIYNKSNNNPNLPFYDTETYGYYNVSRYKFRPNYSETFTEVDTSINNNKHIASGSIISNNYIYSSADYIPKIDMHLIPSMYFSELTDEELENYIQYLENATTFAKLANYSYYDGTPLPNDWVEYTGKDEKFDKYIDTFFNKLNKNSNPTGFKAAILYNAKTETYVISFAGTDFNSNSFKDINSWTRGLLFQDYGQNEQSRIFSDYVMKYLTGKGINKSQIKFVGHSLGGRLAAMNSIIHGVESYIYNPATIPMDMHDMINNKPEWQANLKLINRFSSSDDPLTNFQEILNNHSKEFIEAAKTGVHIGMATLPETLPATLPAITSLVASYPFIINYINNNPEKSQEIYDMLKAVCSPKTISYYSQSKLKLLGETRYPIPEITCGHGIQNYTEGLESLLSDLYTEKVYRQRKQAEFAINQLIETHNRLVETEIRKQNTDFLSNIVEIVP